MSEKCGPTGVKCATCGADVWCCEFSHSDDQCENCYWKEETE